MLIQANSEISVIPLIFKVLLYTCKLSDNTNYGYNNSKSSLAIRYNQVLLYLYKIKQKWSTIMPRLTNLTSDFSLRNTKGRMILLACWILSLSYLLFALSSTPLWNKDFFFSFLHFTCLDLNYRTHLNCDLYSFRQLEKVIVPTKQLCLASFMAKEKSSKPHRLYWSTTLLFW